MVDMTPTIETKSDQLNAEDLLGGAKTIRITNVQSVTGDQPISISYDGDGGKPWKPCKTMRRLLVAAWGSDGSKYHGQSLTLYRDPDVTWAGEKVGGIRVSHMTGLKDGKPLEIMLKANKKSRKKYTIQPLKSDAPPKKELSPAEKEAKAKEAVEKILKKFTPDASNYDEVVAENSSVMERLKKNYPDLHKLITDCKPEGEPSPEGDMVVV
jgi:hypothetical protein